MGDLPSLSLGARPDVRCDVSNGAIKRWDASLRPAAASADDDASITILDVIGEDFWGEGVTAKRIEGALRRIGARAVTVKINSPGGDVFEGGAIYELLRQHSRDRGPVTVQVMGLAASAASIIAMAGDEVLMGRTGFMMIHNSWVMAVGDRNALSEVAEWLEPFDAAMTDVYTARTGQERAKIADMMDRETWLTAARAIDLGFADGYLDDAELTHAGEDENAAAHLRAEKRFDLIAAKAGVERNFARGVLRELKGGQPGAATTGQPGAAEIEAGVADILATLKT